MKIWPNSQFCFLDMYHGEKLYEAVMKGRHRQLLIAFKKHNRASKKKSLQMLAEVIADTFSYPMAFKRVQEDGRSDHHNSPYKYD